MNCYSTYDDLKLVQLLREHDDKHAFAELFNRYWKKLLVQAKIRLGSEVEAEEIVQDVFMNLWRRRNTLILRHSFHTYIASCVKYEILAKLAQFAKDRMFVDSDDATSLEVNTTAEWIDYNGALSAIEDTIKSLPEKCQLVFRMSREEGYSQKEIADKLDISPKTVEAHITKALRAIRYSIQTALITLFLGF
ncbi:RNA polymerase sigma-70 factor [Chryseolinea soli]|uniref:RNA polymerase sigma-70 factor n=1 Tax=Chryseolinea soli TaxID=2321403 RepID=UPI001358BBC8|nr:RNA polymerase sigma-70 factor [Chryseolinea soli]